MYVVLNSTRSKNSPLGVYPTLQDAEKALYEKLDSLKEKISVFYVYRVDIGKPLGGTLLGTYQRKGTQYWDAPAGIYRIRYETKKVYQEQAEPPTAEEVFIAALLAGDPTAKDALQDVLSGRR